MLKLIYRFLSLGLVVSVLALGGCSVPSSSSTQAPSGSMASSDKPPTTAPTTQKSAMSNLPQLTGTATVEMVVNGQPITIEVDGTHAPISAGNFVDLVQRGVYDGTIFHRVVRQPEPFVVQGGDPQTKDSAVPPSRWGTGGFIDPATKQPRQIPLEIQPKGAKEPIYSKTLREAGMSTPPQLQHTRGVVAMARSQMPDSASSQFYFTLADLPFLDGDYAVFGKVTKGMEVVDKIQQGDRIDSAKVTAGADNLKKS
jgi:peptidyl-prolyl cis-trans isomerase B (cyclophilin B)